MPTAKANKRRVKKEMDALVAMCHGRDIYKAGMVILASDVDAEGHLDLYSYEPFARTSHMLSRLLLAVSPFFQSEWKVNLFCTDGYLERHCNGQILDENDCSSGQGSWSDFLNPADPPPEPKPENLRRGQHHNGIGTWAPCVYVDFPGERTFLPVFYGGRWHLREAVYVRPASTGKD